MGTVHERGDREEKRERRELNSSFYEEPLKITHCSCDKTAQSAPDLNAPKAATSNEVALGIQFLTHKLWGHIQTVTALIYCHHSWCTLYPQNLVL
jgi:hypothetical protein